MAYYKKLGVFLKVPGKERVKTRLVPPLSEKDTQELSLAFIQDLIDRLSKLKKVEVALFCHGGGLDSIRELSPPHFSVFPQTGETLGERMANAFESLLAEEDSFAVIIGSDSPDIPLKYIKRAFLKLKHRDVVIGPCTDGGYYLIGLKCPTGALFQDIHWGSDEVLGETFSRIEKMGLTLSVLPVWYDVDEFEDLKLMHALLFARRLEKSDRLHRTERVLERIFEEGGN